jgi:hypothetical protein
LILNANKAGLAGSFQVRREALFWPQITWAVIFVIGTLVLARFGYDELFGDHPITFGADWGTFLQLLGRLLMVAPVIWLTWFAGRQFAYMLRVTEDYAFKEASAMAFVGYRDEMGTDEEMLNLLRRTAIHTFGENPVRILVNGSDVSSPTEELLAHIPRLLKKFSPEQAVNLVDRLNTLVDKIRGR